LDPASTLSVKRFEHRVRAGRLRQVNVEARLLGAGAVAVLAPTRERDQPQVTPARLGAQAGGELITVDSGQADVEHGRVGNEIACERKRALGVVGDSNGVPIEL